jgi:hypothetical protein
MVHKKDQMAEEAVKARAEYEAANRAMHDKTARLRALRLAKEESDRAAAKDAAVAPGRKRRGR